MTEYEQAREEARDTERKFRERLDALVTEQERELTKWVRSVTGRDDLNVKWSEDND